MRLKKFVNGEGKSYQVVMRKPEKYRKLNPKTNRMKNFKRQRFMSTDIAPESRTLDNQPRYADKSPKVTSQQWLEIETEPNSNGGYGKAANGSWVGWSHRAIYSFKTGDKVEGNSLGKKWTYPKLPDGSNDFDNGTYEKDFVIKNDTHAREVAIQFHNNVR